MSEKEWYSDRIIQHNLSTDSLQNEDLEQDSENKKYYYDYSNLTAYLLGLLCGFLFGYMIFG